MKATIHNVESLRDELSRVFDQLKSGELSTPVAREVVNLAGKMTASAKVQCDYYKLRDETPTVAFLESATPARAVKPKVAP